VFPLASIRVGTPFRLVTPNLPFRKLRQASDCYTKKEKEIKKVLLIMLHSQVKNEITH
jgi:hypothetical protein